MGVVRRNRTVARVKCQNEAAMVLLSHLAFAIGLAVPPIYVLALLRSAFLDADATTTTLAPNATELPWTAVAL